MKNKIPLHIKFFLFTVGGIYSNGCIYTVKASKVEQETETNDTNQHIRFKNPDWLESLNQLTIYKSCER